MKIISKFKDYYDYKVAEYGTDENLVYDRRNGMIVDRQRISPEESNLALYSTLYVGSEVVHLFITQNKIYTHFDLVDIERKKRRYYFFDGYCLKFRDGKQYEYKSNLWLGYFSDTADFIRENNGFHIREETHLSWEELSKIPLLLITSDYRTKNQKVYINPNLQELGIYIDPDFVWQHIVQYLSDLKTQAEQSPELPNELKIDSKGFDKKRSFRPKMKGQ